MTKEKRKYRDRALYLIKAVNKRRKKLRQMAIEHKGGKCILCGYKKCAQAFDFHHLNAAQKDFGISMNGLTRSWLRVGKELDKCVMLCANCHREVHVGITQLPVVKPVENGVNSGKPKIVR
ncbi:MAG: hypothetical protein HZC26_01300 [Candidatus Magasanikbacteria bacterium]|nr:hypothetical protein [Candidatus Magasanikbacteria bacterium]